MDGENTVGALELAGYKHIAFARFDAEICIGRTLDEAVEFVVALGWQESMYRGVGPNRSSHPSRGGS